MARKGGQHRNGLNRTIPNQKSTPSREADKEKAKARERKVTDREPLDSYDKYRSDSLSGESINDATGSSLRDRHPSGNSSCKEKLGNKGLNSSQSVDISCKIGDFVESDLLSDVPKTGEAEKLFPCNQNQDISESQTSEAAPAENLMDKTGSSEAVAGWCSRSFFPYVVKEANRWAERLTSYLTSSTVFIQKGHAYVRNKFEHACPVLWTWILCTGKLMLLLSMFWLDCSIRGLDSLLRLGTTSFFTVLWCSILSFMGMIGLKKMLILMVIAASAGAFVGLGLAIIVTSFSAIVILWLYGSFWITGLVIFLGGTSFFLNHERVALLVTTIYSVYCAKGYVGWLGIVLGLNLSFISTDVLIHFLRNINEQKSNHPPEHPEREAFHFSPAGDAFQSGYGSSVDRSSGDPSTSGAEKEVTSEDEVVRLLNCTDHYSALGLRRYDNIDVSLLKKEYRKKAMLVHPDKNMGNEKAAEAFKKLQNAYEVLLDSLKRKTYDDELRREELLNYFRRFQSAPQKKKGRHGIFRSGFSQSEVDDEGPHGESRRIACKRCSDFHLWTSTERSKSRARWCQDCKDFHQAKDGDGWVEQSFQPLLFGLLQKMDLPCAYVCAGSRIYDVTEWFICQGMRCPANTHKPSFHVNTSLTKQSNSKGSSSAQRGSGMPNANIDEAMTEEEFFEWLQNAMQSGMFEAESPSPSNGSLSKSGAGSKKKKKGKKQW
ncbi:uncharacterized protein [Typha latifolia]|uniref:uncharacterized protein n=1 Tax=Typha latifolia TaxID=4733 RepID=UPI003C2F8318